MQTLPTPLYKSYWRGGGAQIENESNGFKFPYLKDGAVVNHWRSTSSPLRRKILQRKKEQPAVHLESDPREGRMNSLEIKGGEAIKPLACQLGFFVLHVVVFEQ